MRLPHLAFYEGAEPPGRNYHPTAPEVDDLERVFRRDYSDVRAHPYRPLAEIRADQFDRIRHLVTAAYEHSEVYRELYDRAGFHPTDLRSWEDFGRVPVVTKGDLRDAGFERWAADGVDREELFITESSGSTGDPLRWGADQAAILRDTVKGVRQFRLQSGKRYSRDHLLAHVGTEPWWFRSIGGDYRRSFVSSQLDEAEIADVLRDLQPHVLSLYPSNLQSLLPHLDERCCERTYLVVVHSAMSTRLQRDRWAAELGVPVLDEYSSEELTRIALELPCGNYHVHEDSVYLEILDPDTMEPVEAGETGIVVATNLLNEAMPFVRYVQGDLAVRPEGTCQCGVNWPLLGSIEGRRNDSFVTPDGTEIAAGTLLDATYLWMIDSGVVPRHFEVIQTAPDEILVNLYGDLSPGALEELSDAIEDSLRGIVDDQVDVTVALEGSSPPAETARPIRRDFDD